MALWNMRVISIYIHILQSAKIEYGELNPDTIEVLIKYISFKDYFMFGLV